MVDVVGVVAQRVDGLDLGHPVRVAIDGITAVGKTTFANDLTSALERMGRDVERVSMDGFHHPRAVRYRQGRSSADGYYEDAYDFVSVRRELLDPLGPGGGLRFRTAVIDLATDTPSTRSRREARSTDVLVVDGSFLQRSEVIPGWDLVVYLQASFEAAEARGVARDADALGGPDAAREVYRSRYHAAQRRYIAECTPSRIADVVIDAEDLDDLRVLVPPYRWVTG